MIKEYWHSWYHIGIPFPTHNNVCFSSKKIDSIVLVSTYDIGAQKLGVVKNNTLAIIVV